MNRSILLGWTFVCGVVSTLAYQTASGKEMSPAVSSGVSSADDETLRATLVFDPGDCTLRKAHVIRIQDALQSHAPRIVAEAVMLNPPDRADERGMLAEAFGLTIPLRPDGGHAAVTLRAQRIGTPAVIFTSGASTLALVGADARDGLSVDALSSLLHALRSREAS